MDISNNPAAATSVQPLESSQPKQVEPKPKEVDVAPAKRQSSFEDWEPFYAVMRDTQIGVVTSSNQMRQLYTGFQNAMLQENPELLEKDWDFSVDEAGELVIIKGKDALSDSEIDQLTDTLEKFGIKDAMNSLADNVIGNLTASRGPEGFAEGDSLGRFDVNKENFKDIVRGRELMLGMQISKGTQLTEGQSMHYAMKTGGTGVNQQEFQSRVAYEYNKGKQPASNLIVQQIMIRAEARY